MVDTCPYCGADGEFADVLANDQAYCPTDQDICPVVSFHRHDGERPTQAAFHCPECEWFQVGAVSGTQDVCAECGAELLEKVLTASTVFRQSERNQEVPR